MPLITHERLLELLHYDPQTGIFTRRVRVQKYRVGTVVGCPSTNGHLQIRLDCEKYYAHRLAWFYMTTTWPELVDHINGKPADNRQANLRESNPRDNAFNRAGLNSNNSSGERGIHQRGNRFLVYLKGEYRGSYSTMRAAVARRDQVLSW